MRNGEKQTMLLYRFGYLPAGLFNRWQVRLFLLSDQEVIWKSGSVLRKDGHIALIEEIKSASFWSSLNCNSLEHLILRLCNNKIIYLLVAT